MTRCPTHGQSPHCTVGCMVCLNPWNDSLVGMENRLTRHTVIVAEQVAAYEAPTVAAIVAWLRTGSCDAGRMVDVDKLAHAIERGEWKVTK